MTNYKVTMELNTGRTITVIISAINELQAPLVAVRTIRKAYGEDSITARVTKIEKLGALNNEN